MMNIHTDIKLVPLTCTATEKIHKNYKIVVSPLFVLNTVQQQQSNIASHIARYTSVTKLLEFWWSRISRSRSKTRLGCIVYGHTAVEKVHVSHM